MDLHVGGGRRYRCMYMYWLCCKMWVVGWVEVESDGVCKVVGVFSRMVWGCVY